MRKALLMLIAVLALALPLALPAAAESPRVQIETFTPFVTDACSFPVEMAPLTNKEYVTTFTNRRGVKQLQITTGRLTVRLTNVTTGKSIDLNISGPGQYTVNTDDTALLRTQGPWLFFLPQGVLPSVTPRLFQINGQVESHFDASGTQTDLRVRAGHVVDLCAVLQ